MRKLLINVIISLITAISFPNLYAAGLSIELTFAQAGVPKAFAAPKAIEKAVELSGIVVIDITPYPATIEHNRYEVQYFLNSQLLYDTTGLKEDSPDSLDFKFVFDTTGYESGEYRLIVNFWDEKGPSAIGIKQITIKN